MNRRAFQLSVLGVLFTLISGNIVMSLMSVHLFVPTLAGMFGFACLLEWRRRPRIHFLLISLAAFMLMSCRLIGVAMLLSLRTQPVDVWKPAVLGEAEPFRFIQFVVYLLGFLASVCAIVGTLVWILTNLHRAASQTSTGDPSPAE